LGVMPHIAVDDCALVVIDAQDCFYDSGRDDVDRDALGSALSRAAWVCAVATALGMPAVVTEEDADRNGHTDAAILAAVATGTTAHDKAVFGADDNPDIDAAVRATGKGTLVLVGLETDVCVAQSALGWASAGFRVVVVRDAVFSVGQAHDFGLARLREEGIELISAKEIYYEWLRTLSAVRAFDAAHPDLASPPGFSL
jgi:nicotinamidase-related amidase